ncbi:phosphoribosylformylglycinamidine synthase subunit PurQ [Cerasicoccus maritimus]|uniref:phosphoribosylformylglycinamidine synthase subunit PurQ n=1 Tax=Cerasicoccus maritimus TaxID=490089 RepID=UPI0028525F6A|nr:phosphoribosylformylglycinamidine synthase subunit PurQ [Cerasicoccus maritimus]
MKVGIVQLPGASGDRDMLHALISHLHVRARLFSHKCSSFAGADAVIIPGGASFGDYLRAGAIAKSTPIIKAVKEFAANGGPVLGIGNGFQVLCEASLLPGAFTENNSREHHYGNQTLTVEDSTKNFNKNRLGDNISLPVSHRFGRYWVDDKKLDSMQSNNQIMFRYVNNPNGSVGDIAAIRNAEQNVFGMMPHPEAAVEESVHNTTIGARILSAFLKQPRVEPQRPQLDPAVQGEVEKMLIHCASEMTLDSIHAYLPQQELLLSINGQRTMQSSEPDEGIGAYLHKLYAQSSGENPQSMATTMAEHYVVTDVGPKLSLMTVSTRKKVALVRLMKEVETLNGNLSKLLD